ncbi:Oligosaccharyltransferase complex subunit ostc-B [Acipenser ruthenus]|uniref:Oligosaccharyltransferase complex subunit n=1 Tax=Acipenser ruthenus TaxID=7906 RepID=A0A444UM14_ACIRT|nr:Oligosaccharyltransferase complex subunit ostc-B [Acipenser ruthenus]
MYGIPFTVLECANLKLKKPSWLHMPSAMTVYALVIVSYFLITGGIIYDVIVEPPSVGSMTDEHGHQRPVAFLAYRYDNTVPTTLYTSLYNTKQIPASVHRICQRLAQFFHGQSIYEDEAAGIPYGLKTSFPENEHEHGFWKYVNREEEILEAAETTVGYL